MVGGVRWPDSRRNVWSKDGHMLWELPGVCVCGGGRSNKPRWQVALRWHLSLVGHGDPPSSLKHKSGAFRLLETW